MAIQTATLGYPRIGRNREVNIQNLPLKQIWVNPDCGLKTRRWEEVIPALKNMVAAAAILREEANAGAK